MTEEEKLEVQRKAERREKEDRELLADVRAVTDSVQREDRQPISDPASVSAPLPIPDATPPAAASRTAPDIPPSRPTNLPTPPKQPIPIPSPAESRSGIDIPVQQAARVESSAGHVAIPIPDASATTEPVASAATIPGTGQTTEQRHTESIVIPEPPRRDEYVRARRPVDAGWTPATAKGLDLRDAVPEREADPSPSGADMSNSLVSYNRVLVDVLGRMQNALFEMRTDLELMRRRFDRM